MNEHPEVDPKISELMSFVFSIETVDVWCLKCEKFTKMNANYAKYLSGEIESCGTCKD